MIRYAESTKHLAELLDLVPEFLRLRIWHEGLLQGATRAAADEHVLTLHLWSQNVAHARNSC